MAARNNLTKGVGMFFWPFPAAVLIDFGICIWVTTHLVGVRPSKRVVSHCVV